MKKSKVTSHLRKTLVPFQVFGIPLIVHYPRNLSVLLCECVIPANILRISTARAFVGFHCESPNVIVLLIEFAVN